MTAMKMRAPSASFSARSMSSSSGPPAVRLATTSVTPTAEALLLGVGDDVLDRLARLLLDALDEVAAQPARPGLRQRGDDDLVGREGRQRVGGRGEGVLVADLAGQLDALRAEVGLREVDAQLGGVALGVVVDDVAVPRA
jgi:hypothetical protein